MVYEDFELVAVPVQDTKADRSKKITFQVQVVRSPAGEQIDGVPSQYSPDEMRRRLRGLKTRIVGWEHVIQVGKWLSALLFPGPVHQLLQSSIDRVKAQKKRLRIRLLLEGSLCNVPWEYVLLNRGGGEATVTDFLSLMPDVSITRHQAATLPPWEVKVEHTARLVAAFANPKSQKYKALKVDKEQRLIEKAIERNERIKAIFVTNATPETLMKDVGEIHLFHFAGHGGLQVRTVDSSGEVGGEGFIVLEDGSSGEVLLSAGQLALQLRRAGVRVAVFGACHSGRRDDVNAWSSIAAALLKAELGAVVAMQYFIGDNSTIAFVDKFYHALVSGLSIDEAVTHGRIAVTQINTCDWGVPVLYLRASDGIIFPEYMADSALEQVREQMRINVQQQVKVIGGKLIGAEAARMTRGEVKVKHKVGKVTKSGEVIGFKGQQMDGGRVETDQRVEKVDDGGSVTGVRLDK